MVNLIHKIWTIIQQDIQNEGYTQYMPIWNNLQLPRWRGLRILIYSKRLVLSFCDNEVLQPFAKLAERYQLPNKLFF